MRMPRSLPPNASQEDQRYFLEQVSRHLSGNITFGTTTSNNDSDLDMACWKATGTTPGSPNTEFSVASAAGVKFFNDGHVPWFFMYFLDKAGDLYKSTTTWTNSTIYLKCSVATAAYTIIVL